MAMSADNEKAAPRPGDSYVQSFARGLEVIRTFSSAAPQQTLTEVAGRSGLTRAGARRILLTLQTLGYVETDGRQFRLTPRILDLGFAYLSSMPIWNLAEPVMEGLVERVKESCSAAVLEGTDIMYVLRVPTHKIMRINLGLGSLPDEEVERRLAGAELPARTEHTLTRVDDVLARVRQARDQGWCLVDQELEEGLISMAAPVVNRNGRVIAALNISGQANRSNAFDMQNRMLPHLLQAAQSISRMVGTPRT